LIPESIDTTATANFENVSGAWTVTSSHLETRVNSPDADPARFQKAAEGAKAGCPISRLLNTTITMNTRLV
jgi:lipoyl-dependent peroxiredoxin